MVKQSLTLLSPQAFVSHSGVDSAVMASLLEWKIEDIYFSSYSCETDRTSEVTVVAKMVVDGRLSEHDSIENYNDRFLRFDGGGKGLVRKDQSLKRPLIRIAKVDSTIPTKVIQKELFLIRLKQEAPTKNSLKVSSTFTADDYRRLRQIRVLGGGLHFYLYKNLDEKYLIGAKDLCVPGAIEYAETHGFNHDISNREIADSITGWHNRFGCELLSLADNYLLLEFLEAPVDLEVFLDEVMVVCPGVFELGSVGNYTKSEIARAKCAFKKQFLETLVLNLYWS